MAHPITSCLILIAAITFTVAAFLASAGAAMFGFALVGFGQNSAVLLFGFAIAGVAFGVRFALRVVIPFARSMLPELRDD
jgi:hypothetical protein